VDATVSSPGTASSVAGVPLQDESLKSKQGDIQLSDQTLVTGTLLSVCCLPCVLISCRLCSLLSVINLPHTFSITPTPGARKYVITARDDKVRRLSAVRPSSVVVHD
jgi:hypothetical protein